jgi:hypothetical protein
VNNSGTLTARQPMSRKVSLSGMQAGSVVMGMS